MKKLTPKAETFQILRNSGKNLQEAYRMAGFKGDATGSAPYKLEGNIKKHTLCDPKLLKISKKVAKHILEIAEESLAEARKSAPDKALQSLCIKSALQLIQGQQDRIEPKRNLNFNANVNANLHDTVIDFSQFRRKDIPTPYQDSKG